MREIRTWLRFAAVIWGMIYVISLSFILYPIVSHAFWRKWIHKHWARYMVWAVGAKLEINTTLGKNYIQPNTMFAQNHISWLDTLVMSSVHCVNYVGKVEMLKWGLIRNVIKSGGTVFINRKNKRELVTANKKIAAVLADGWGMGLFPEGTTSDGTAILPFHASIFEAAMIAKSRVVPAVLRYRHAKGGGLVTEVTFAGKGWMETVMNTLRVDDLVIKIDVLEPVNAADFPDRESLSQYMYAKISDFYHSDLKAN
jgi:1-acyl-sn-glycerol-3-phosphate acyltransferase